MKLYAVAVLTILIATAFVPRVEAHASPRLSCPPVSSIHTMPFRGERGEDAAYDKLRFDVRCETTLLRALGSTKPMHDPRQMPIDERFVEGDAALLILIERHNLHVEQVLPESWAARWKEDGMYAYFDYVSTKEGRADVTRRLKSSLAHGK
ncbi:MAG: hypothetical protein GC190_12470 [Alphaproteobacteria bacterium]|nr:hypothetical protein [Alphaproteobacteria bacterium]